MLKSIIEQNMSHIIWFLTILILGLIVFKVWKFYRITNLDRNHKKMDSQGNVIQEGITRPIWDYHFFPGLSRLWHKSEWQQAVAVGLIFFFGFLYLYTRENSVLNLLGINLGVVLGMMIERARKP